MIKHQSIRLTFFYCILICIVSSCNNNTQKDNINIAESLLENNDNPAECLLILSKIDYESINSNREKARYGYLYARSIHKLNQQMDTDLYIKRSVDYYASKGESTELMKSLFYYSNHLFEKGLIENAVKIIMKSRQIASKNKDYYWHGKIAELIADMLGYNYNHSESIKYREEAALFYKKAGREDNARYCYIDLAISYSNTMDFDNCVSLVDSILSIAKSENDSVLTAYCYLTKYNAFIRNKDYINGEFFLDKFFSMDKVYPVSSRDYCNKALMLINRNKLDSAEIILKKLKKIDPDIHQNGTYYSALRNLYFYKGLYKKALEYSDTLSILNNASVRNSDRQEIVAYQRDFLDDNLVIANLKAEQQKLLLIGGIFISIIIICSIILIFNYHLKAKTVESDNKIAQIMAVSEELTNENIRLSSVLNEQKEQNDKIKKEVRSPYIENLFYEKWTMLNFLCNEYFEKGDNPKIRIFILNSIEKKLKEFQQEKNLNEIERSVDLFRDGIITKLRQQCQFFNEDAIKFIVLSMAGLSPRAICLLLNLSYNYYYTKKNRIINKIKKSDVPDRDLFLNYLK